MKKLIFYMVITGLLAGCGKSGGGNGTAAEAALTFTINPDPGTTVFPALSASQDVAVAVTSALPAAGVTIDINVTRDLDNSTVFNQSISSSLSNFTIVIQNLSGGAVCTATITVTSKSTTTNKASKTFKIAKK